jgi:hypothetical protein
MNDDYLWDRSGEPDDTVRHLESVLFEYRYAGRPIRVFAVPSRLTRREGRRVRAESTS